MKRIIIAVVMTAFAMPSIASAFPVSSASNGVVQSQRSPNRCHMRGSYPFNLSDLSCTPGALNRAVTGSTVGTTICRRGWTATQRPSTGVTEPEKLASMRAYGVHRSPGQYEYDHLISLELGGATNDARNLWPEPGDSPNLKDKVENSLHHTVVRRYGVIGSRPAHRRTRLGPLLQNRSGSAEAPAPATPAPAHPGWTA
jgi:hypothetical protein